MVIPLEHVLLRSKQAGEMDIVLAEGSFATMGNAMLAERHKL